jgi:glucosylceramidase
MDAYFGPDGIQYTFGRVPIGACDFSESPEWSYDNSPGDGSLSTLSAVHAPRRVF